MRITQPSWAICQSGFRSYLAHRVLTAAGLDSASLDGGLTWTSTATLKFTGGTNTTKTVLMRAAPVPANDTYTRNETIVVASHLDTVPVDGMTVDPFGGDVRNGRIYGRGACDVKGSMAAMLAAISRTVKTNVKSRNSPTIAIAFTVNEECGF